MTATPKGWEKVSERKLAVVWKHNDGTIISIEKEVLFDGDKNKQFWVIYVNNKKMSVFSNFKTKSEAESFAIRWMRQHPNG